MAATTQGTAHIYNLDSFDENTTTVISNITFQGIDVGHEPRVDTVVTDQEGVALEYRRDDVEKTLTVTGTLLSGFTLPTPNLQLVTITGGQAAGDYMLMDASVTGQAGEVMTVSLTLRKPTSITVS